MRRVITTLWLIFPMLAPFAAGAGQPPPAAPADCPASASPAPPGSGDSSAPVTVFPALPGGGFAAVNLGAAALNGTTCTPASPPLPKDVLHGDPDGNLLNDQGDAVLDGGGGGGGGD
jgi:hypothetical protein